MLDTCGPAMSGTSPAGAPSASSTSRAATSPVSTGWNRTPAGTGITGSFAICPTTIRERSWNWVARSVVHGQAGLGHDPLRGQLEPEVAEHRPVGAR